MAARSISVIFLYFQILTCCSLLIVQQKKRDMPSLNLLERRSLVIDPCIFIQFFYSSCFLLHYYIITASIRLTHNLFLMTTGADSLSRDCLATKTVSKRLKWDCVSFLCISPCFFILRRAVRFLKRRHKSGESPAESTFQSLLVLATTPNLRGVFF